MTGNCRKAKSEELSADSGRYELIDRRVLAWLTDMNHFPWPDGGNSLVNLFLHRHIMNEAIPCYMHNHNSISQHRKIVLVFKPAVDR